MVIWMFCGFVLPSPDSAPKQMSASSGPPRNSSEGHRFFVEQRIYASFSGRNLR